MKKSTYYKLILLILIVVISSCVQDDDFDTPDITIVPPLIDGQVIELNVLNSLFEQAVIQAADNQGVDPDDFFFDQIINELRNTVTLPFETGANLYTSGYVISNDESGNFFEELVIQNDYANPNRGAKILIDVNPLFTSLEFGRKVFVKLDGLVIGRNSGVLSIGVLNNNRIDKIAESSFEDVIQRDIVVEQIIPKPITFTDFNYDTTNLYITLSDVQFNRKDILPTPKTFAGAPGDVFDGERRLENCLGRTVIFSTSTFSDFKGALLPTGTGDLDGILNLDFFAEYFNIVVNDPSALRLDVANRCDPEVCEGETGDTVILFSEDFQAFADIEDYVNAGWTNVNVSGGSVLWEIDGFDDNNYGVISGFNSDEDEIQSWLVTPSIDLDSTIEETLNFEVQSGFDNGALLSMLYSTNFNGDVLAADWFRLDADTPLGPMNAFGDFTSLGPISISCFEGSFNVAFRYIGSDSGGQTTRFHVDNIEVIGN